VCAILLRRTLLIWVVVWIVTIRRHPRSLYKMRNPSDIAIPLTLDKSTGDGKTAVDIWGRRRVLGWR
jgi:hypothetical protein